MSNPQPADRRSSILAGEFSRLEPADQDLVLALVARLLAGTPDPFTEAPVHDPDVPFMDFDG